MKKIILGISGASGGDIARRLATAMSYMDLELHIIITSHGEKVFRYETGEDFHHFASGLAGNRAKIFIHDNGDLFAPPASGSGGFSAMLIAPCSMATAGKIASGTGDNLLCRAADCCLKEKLPLVVCPREAPLSSIHLRNLLALSETGAFIVPPVPAFYSGGDYNSLMDGIAGRILKCAGIDNGLYYRWRTENEEN